MNSKHNHLPKYIGAIAVALALAACNPSLSQEEVTPNQAPSETVTLESLVQKPLQVIVKDNQLTLVQPDEKQLLEMQTVHAEALPTELHHKAFTFSPSRNYFAWYNPAQGIFVFDLRENRYASVYKPSKWFNTFPHLEMHPSQDWLYFIDNEGTRLHRINLVSNEHFSVEIPHPFGTRFVISPDGQEIAFISGFNQDEGSASYMVTNIDGTNPRRFKTEVELADRHHISWMPDSSGILVIETGSTLSMYPTEAGQEMKKILTVDEGVRILRLEKVDDRVFLQTNQGYWQMIDPLTNSVAAQIPEHIASELNDPHFIPWSKDQFVIEETIKTPETQYHRMWLSDFRGAKEIVVEKYEETRVETITPQI